MAPATTIAAIAVRIVELAVPKPFEERSNLIGSIHDRLVREVGSAGGSLRRNSGENLMATFGASIPTGRNASRALLCSGAMVQAVDEFNAIELNGNGSSIMVTIGVHCGSVPLGNIGGECRLDVAALTNSTVSGNDGDYAPGGIRNAGILTLTNSTVSGNHNRYDGGSADGIQSDSIGQTQATNSIIAANVTTKYGIENCSGPFVSNGHNLSDDTTCFPAAGADLVVADAMLAPLADNGGPTDTHDLLPGSPAIDAGDDIACPATDQRGEARPIDGDGDGMAHCDIGAVEFVPEPHHPATLIAGAALLALLYRRRTRDLEGTVCSGQV